MNAESLERAANNSFRAQELCRATRWTYDDWLAALEHLGTRATPEVIESLQQWNAFPSVAVVARSWFPSQETR